MRAQKGERMYRYDARVIGDGAGSFVLKVFSPLRHGDDVAHEGVAYRVELMPLALKLGALPVVVLRRMAPPAP